MFHKTMAFSDFEACNEALRNICGPYQIASGGWRDLRGHVSARHAGSLGFADVVLSGGCVVRDKSDVHVQGEKVFLILQAAGTSRMHQQGREAILREGDCTLIDSRLPSAFEVGPGFHQYSFHLPAALVTDRLGACRLPVGNTIRSDCGAGALLSRLLYGIVDNGPSLEGADLMAATLDLLGCALGMKHATSRPTRSRRHALSVPNIRRFIDANLDDPELSPATIAAKFNTSVRQLYRLVGATETTPSALIWSRRLEHARELLVQADSSVFIIDVALACGFKDAAHFSRAYRHAFGHPPKFARSLADSVAIIRPC